MARFFELLAKEPNKVAYGIDHVKRVLAMGAVDTLLLSESLDDDLIEQLEEEAENLSSKTEIISTETTEGVQLKDLGGIAAILRYSVE